MTDYALHLSNDPQAQGLRLKQQNHEDTRLKEVVLEGEVYNLKTHLKSMIQHDKQSIAGSHCRGCFMLDHFSWQDLKDMEYALLGK